MGEAHELQCPNCGSNDHTQQAPALFRCKYCRSIYSPKFDIRGPAQPPQPPVQPWPTPHAGQQPPVHPLTAMMNKDTASRYLFLGFISFFVCGAIAPVIWYVGYREARHKGEDPGALLILSLVVGIPVVAFLMLIVGLVITGELK